MTKSDYIPRKDADYLQWMNNFIANLAGLIDKSGFPQERYDQLASLHNEFAQRLAEAGNAATRTVITIREKNEARAALSKEVRQAVKEFLAHNSAISDSDRGLLGVTVYKASRTPAPVASTYPDFDVDSSVIRRLSIRFYDSGSRAKAKPAGQHGVEIRWSVLDAPPASIDALTRSSFDTRTPFTLSFDENQRGKSVYFCLCWENTRGEKGPWSEIVCAIVP
jgi:hypothetical protein